MRLTWFVTSKKEYLARLRELGAAYKSVMGRHYTGVRTSVYTAVHYLR